MKTGTVKKQPKILGLLCVILYRASDVTKRKQAAL